MKEVFENIIEKLQGEVNESDRKYNALIDDGELRCVFDWSDLEDRRKQTLEYAIEIVKQAYENYENTLHETMIELLSGAWVDSDKVQSVLGLSFAECLSLLDFSRTTEWWSIAGKIEEERAREGQKIDTRFRLKNNGWIPCSECVDCKHKECENYGKV